MSRKKLQLVHSSGGWNIYEIIFVIQVLVMKKKKKAMYLCENLRSCDATSAFIRLH